MSREHSTHPKACEPCGRAQVSGCCCCAGSHYGPGPGELDPSPARIQRLSDPGPARIQGLSDPSPARMQRLSDPSERANLGAVASCGFSGTVTLRLLPEFVDTAASSLEELVAENEGLVGLGSVLETFKLADRSRRSISDLSGEELEKLEVSIPQSHTRPRHSLLSYWRLDLRDRPRDAASVVDALNELPEVGVAYRELVVTDPLPAEAEIDPAADQGYVAAAPWGVAAQFAWDQGQLGEGVGLVDVEQGWIGDHEDLGNIGDLISGANRRIEDGAYPGHHGTAVLGVVGASHDNGKGINGIAPATKVRMSSHFRRTGDHNVAEAITTALPDMKPGDVLLLEVQRCCGKPTEVDEADFTAIQLAAALGIVVIEPAGNGDGDLDRLLDRNCNPSFNRAHPSFLDSGAIMVGSSVASLPHHRFVGDGEGDGSNYGSRVDCFAWGEKITTCGYGDLIDGRGDNKKAYTGNFGGTSGAAAIIAAVAAVVQGKYRCESTVEPKVLTPREMRLLLSEPGFGTQQGHVVPGRIGVMPDLGRILPAIMGRRAT